MREAGEAFLAEIAANWGGPVGIETRAPSRAADPAFRAWWSNYLRQGASPGAAATLTRMNAAIDVRDVLPLVRVPTLVLHRTGDRCLLVEEGRYVASLIPGAQFVELDGDDHLPFLGDQDVMIDRIQAFVTSAAQAQPQDRVLATVLWARVAETSGRADNRRAYEAHVQQEMAWFRGRGLTFTTDGFFAAFDGPARAISCARSLTAAAPRFGLSGAFGLHTGECDLSPEGRNAGAAFERARAVCDFAAAGDVLVSRTVTDLVAGSGLTFVDRGSQSLVAGTEPWRLFAVADDPETMARQLTVQSDAENTPKRRRRIT